jgi:hypothetical protein
MNEKIFSYLKVVGFTYLWRKFGERAYRPMKGNLEQLHAGTCNSALGRRFIVNTFYNSIVCFFYQKNNVDNKKEKALGTDLTY